MDRPRFLRGLRIAASVLLGVVGLVLVVFWVRSYQATDVMQLSVPWVRIGAFSGNGSVAMWVAREKRGESTIWDVTPHKHIQDIELFSERTFRTFPVERGLGLHVPYWLLILILAAAGAAVWTIRARFSLRTMLIAMLILAVPMAAAAGIRWW